MEMCPSVYERHSNLHSNPKKCPIVEKQDIIGHIWMSVRSESVLESLFVQYGILLEVSLQLRLGYFVGDKAGYSTCTYKNMYIKIKHQQCIATSHELWRLSSCDAFCRFSLFTLLFFFGSFLPLFLYKVILWRLKLVISASNLKSEKRHLKTGWWFERLAGTHNS